jgi:hypothetical protein
LLFVVGLTVGLDVRLRGGVRYGINQLKEEEEKERYDEKWE